MDSAPVVAAFLAAAIPLLRVAWTASGTPDAFWFGADRHQLELRALAASRGNLALGAFSVYGWQHPGPSLFYWFAPFYAGAGREPVGMVVATVVANVAGLTALAFLLRRFGGPPAGWVAAAGVAFFVWRFGVEGLWVSWNPNLTVVPTALLIVSVTGLVLGHRWAAPLAVALASWLVQAHLGTGVTVVGVGLVAAGAAAARIRGGSPADRRRWRAPLVAAFLVGLVFWLPPLVDQVAGTHNMGTIGRYLVGGELGPGASFPFGGPPDRAFTPGDAAAEVGLAGSLLSERETGVVIGPERWSAQAIAPSRVTTVAFAALVAATAGLAVVGWRRGRASSAALCGVTALAAALAYVSAMTARGQPSHHIVAFVAGVGLCVWIAVVRAVAEELAERWSRPTARPARLVPGGGAGPRPWLAAAGVVALAVTVVPLARRPARLVRWDGGPAPPVAEAVAQRAAGRIVVDTDASDDALLLPVVLDLAVAGHDVRVPEDRQLAFTTEQAMPRTWDTSVFLAQSPGPPPGAGWRRVATLPDGSGGEVTVHVRPGPARR